MPQVLCSTFSRRNISALAAGNNGSRRRQQKKAVEEGNDGLRLFPTGESLCHGSAFSWISFQSPGAVWVVHSTAPLHSSLQTKKGAPLRAPQVREEMPGEVGHERGGVRKVQVYHPH